MSYRILSVYAGNLFGGPIEEGNTPVQPDREDTFIDRVKNGITIAYRIVFLMLPFFLEIELTFYSCFDHFHTIMQNATSNSSFALL